jgi:hypothetical protein
MPGVLCALSTGLLIVNEDSGFGLLKKTVGVDVGDFVGAEVGTEVGMNVWPGGKGVGATVVGAGVGGLSSCLQIGVAK